MRKLVVVLVALGVVISYLGYLQWEGSAAKLPTSPPIDTVAVTSRSPVSTLSTSAVQTELPETSTREAIIPHLDSTRSPASSPFPSRSPVTVPRTSKPAAVRPSSSKKALDWSDSRLLPSDQSSWEKKLYTPTYIDFFFNVWIIVDCWHHRVVFHPNLSAPVAQWRDLDEGHGQKHHQMKIPHTVATDGTLLLLESSVGGSSGSNHSVLVYTPKDGDGAAGFDFVEEVQACPEGGARRPHRLSYDEATSAFYLYLTDPPHLAKFVRNDRGSITRVYCKALPFMPTSGATYYARSFHFHQGFMYLTAGPAITKVDYANATAARPPTRVRTYSPKKLGFKPSKMNDIAYFDGWWYATGTIGCDIVRFRDIDKMKPESLKGKLGMCIDVPRGKKHCRGGTPYFMSRVNGVYYLPYIFGCSGIISFRLQEDGATIGNVTTLFGTGWVEAPDDIARRGKQW